MTRSFAMPLISALSLVPVLLLSWAADGQEAAKKATFQVEKADTVRSLLSRHVDKKVTLVLVQGTELTGTVRSVGDAVVHLSDLAGKEFYDAVVDLSKIAAVVVRTR